MNIKERNRRQLEEIQGETNRYYFWQRNGRPPESRNELASFYIQQGGAVAFAKNNKYGR